MTSKVDMVTIIRVQVTERETAFCSQKVKTSGACSPPDVI